MDVNEKASVSFISGLSIYTISISISRIRLFTESNFEPPPLSKLILGPLIPPSVTEALIELNFLLSYSYFFWSIIVTLLLLSV